MFKNILLPTDGSELSSAAIREGIRLAKFVDAKVTGLSVMPLRYPFFYEMGIPDQVLEQTEKQRQELAESYLAEVGNAAREAGVVCELVYQESDFPHDAIIRLAEQNHCDLIMMASHGRRGVKAILLGSETQKVLTHSKVPVLVYR